MFHTCLRDIDAEKKKEKDKIMLLLIVWGAYVV